MVAANDQSDLDNYFYQEGTISGLAANDSQSSEPHSKINEFWVCKSHALARATTSKLLRNEIRVLTLAISRVNPTAGLEQRARNYFDGTFAEERVVHVIAEQFISAFNVTRSSSLRAFKGAAKSLKKLEVLISNPQNEDIKIKAIENAYYDSSLGCIEIKFTSEYYSQLINLVDRTRPNIKYRVGDVVNFDSYRTFKLHEYLLSKQQTGVYENTRTVPLYELRQLLNIPDKHSYNTIKNKVIDVTVRELVDAGWHITWKPKRHGKKYTGVEFKYKVKK
ncbi:replication initiation protein [Methylophaga sp. OBS3]|uniref:replication initiation protein n=1 Tax=Methylophaga sp. OBS3 TaxID=2991934 RepID=UPI00224EBAD8|nr:replication initiation protein [Methylophaga sp. OBS3]MCX4190267.1 replication initiation protein [Methylophaga sp. OBS3]